MRGNVICISIVAVFVLSLFASQTFGLYSGKAPVCPSAPLELQVGAKTLWYNGAATLGCNISVSSNFTLSNFNLSFTSNSTRHVGINILGNATQFYFVNGSNLSVSGDNNTFIHYAYDATPARIKFSDSKVDKIGINPNAANTDVSNGIHLHNVHNATFQYTNMTCTNSYKCLYLTTGSGATSYYSPNVTNSVFRNFQGIALQMDGGTANRQVGASGNTFTAKAGYTPTAIYLTTVPAKIYGNRIIGGGNGIQNDDGAVIRNNIISGAGVGIIGTSDSDTVIIANNRIENSSSDAIQVQGNCDDYYISYNQLRNVSDGIQLSNTSGQAPQNVWIYHNYFWNDTAMCIRANGGTNLSIIKNDCKDATNVGIQIEGAKNNTMYHNNFTRIGNYSIKIVGSGNLTAFENTLYDWFVLSVSADTKWYNQTENHGNYWGNKTTPDSNFDGIVDVPYVIRGTSGRSDAYPLAVPFGQSVATSFPVQEDYIPIIGYHKVIWDGEVNDDPTAEINVTTFKNQLMYLNNTVGCHFLTMEKVADYLRNNTKLPTKSCAITFDDANMYQYLNARRILQLYKIPATFYVPTDLVGTGSVTINGTPRSAYMTWAELGDLVAQGHALGSHTLNHTKFLTYHLTPAEITSQVADSKAAIEAHGFPCHTIAYPYGEYNQTVINALIASGYWAARDSEKLHLTYWETKAATTRAGGNHTWHMNYIKPEQLTYVQLVNKTKYHGWYQFNEVFQVVTDADGDINTMSSVRPTNTSYGVLALPDLNDRVNNQFLVKAKDNFTIEIWGYTASGPSENTSTTRYTRLNRTDVYVDNVEIQQIKGDWTQCVSGGTSQWIYCPYTVYVQLNAGRHNLSMKVNQSAIRIDKFRLYSDHDSQNFYDIRTTLPMMYSATSPRNWTGGSYTGVKPNCTGLYVNVNQPTKWLNLHANLSCPVVVSSNLTISNSTIRFFNGNTNTTQRGFNISANATAFQFVNRSNWTSVGNNSYLWYAFDSYTVGNNADIVFENSYIEKIGQGLNSGVIPGRFDVGRNKGIHILSCGDKSKFDHMTVANSSFAMFISYGNSGYIDCQMPINHSTFKRIRYVALDLEGRGGNGTIRVHNSNFSGMYDGVAFTENVYAIFIANTQGFWGKNNRATGFSYVYDITQSDTDCLIEDNYMYNTKNPIVLNTNIHRCSFLNNTMTTTLGNSDCIAFQSGSSRNIVDTLRCTSASSDCVQVYAAAGGANIPASNNSFNKVFCINPSSTCFFVQNASNTTIRNSYCTGAGGNGIFVKGRSSGNTIMYTNFTSITGYSLHVSDAPTGANGSAQYCNFFDPEVVIDSNLWLMRRNFYSNLTTPNTNPRDNIVDTWFKFTGTASAKDRYSLAFKYPVTANNTVPSVQWINITPTTGDGNQDFTVKVRAYDVNLYDRLRYDCRIWSNQTPTHTVTTISSINQSNFTTQNFTINHDFTSTNDYIVFSCNVSDALGTSTTEFNSATITITDIIDGGAPPAATPTPAATATPPPLGGGGGGNNGGSGDQIIYVGNRKFDFEIIPKEKTLAVPKEFRTSGEYQIKNYAENSINITLSIDKTSSPEMKDWVKFDGSGNSESRKFVLPGTPGFEQGSSYIRYSVFVPENTTTGEYKLVFKVDAEGKLVKYHTVTVIVQESVKNQLSALFNSVLFDLRNQICAIPSDQYSSAEECIANTTPIEVKTGYVGAGVGGIFLIYLLRMWFA